MLDNETRPITSFNESSQMPAENLDEYAMGATDTRLWGTWEVIEEPQKEDGKITQCVKKITVNPQNALSLQMHEKRSEVWTVLEGELTAIVDDKVHTLKKGESIQIPQGAIHCMANLTGEPVAVHEIQSGICQEADNIRLMDAGGRPTTDIIHLHLKDARSNYAKIVKAISSPNRNNKKVI